MKVWIVRENDDTIAVTQTAGVAYQYCRNVIKNLKFDSEYDEEQCLSELEHSYSECRDAFGVKGIIEVWSSDLITLF